MSRYATAYPLTWPEGWPRRRVRTSSQFKKHSLIEGVRQCQDELRKMSIEEGSMIVSSNIEVRRDGLPYLNRRAPEDPGIAVYFRWEGEDHVLACDKWATPEHNLWAIGLHIAALRGQERWGVGTLKQAFLGYKALPEAVNWRSVIGVDHEADYDTAKARYRQLVKIAHPDQGGSSERFVEITKAWKQARQEFGETHV